MATYRTRASGSVEVTIRRKGLLPGRVFLTFENMAKAEAYCREVEAMLDAGIVPPGLLDIARKEEASRDPMAKTLADVFRQYELEYSVKADDVAWLNVIADEVGDTRLDAVTVKWANDLIRGYKIRPRPLAPSTIRHRIGAMARCLDWLATQKGDIPLNPLRLLPKRYAVYNEAEQKALAVAGSQAPASNNERDRRLEPGEEGRIRKVLANDPEYLASLGVERGLRPESLRPMLMIFEMAIESAMRMREMFTLDVDQIDLERRTIFLDRTKNGDKRQVPTSSVLTRLLADYISGKDGLLFPEFWSGDASDAGLRAATNRLSRRWATVARLAKCDDLRFHDLRHEATSRLFERTKMTDTKIASITGHKDPRMLKRYANLRASTLAEEMW